MTQKSAVEGVLDEWMRLIDEITGRKPPKIKGVGGGGIKLAPIPWEP
jgi:hypothetical protein